MRRISLALTAKEATGVSYWGPELRKWPVREYEAALIIFGETNRLENARNRAESKET